jgi:mono/diheme cytochrome c family protein
MDMKRLLKKSHLIVLLAILMFSFTQQQDYEAEKTFKQNCSSCHTIGQGKLSGPDLKGVSERRTEEWLLKFIKSPKSSIKSRDETALSLYYEYGQILMPNQNLTDQQIKEILKYIKMKEEYP